MILNKPVDLMMWVGREYYTVSSFIEEAERLGVSKRIPHTAIPEGIVPGLSRLFLKHLDACIEIGKYGTEALALELGLNSDQDMLDFVIALDHLKEEDFSSWKEIIYRYQITFHPGVFGYCYITGLQYIAKDNEEGLPEDLVAFEGYIEPVRLGDKEE
jgi:hypothetical protein